MPTGPASSVIFSAGWYTTGENVDSPEQLDVALDKDSYKSGETAKLRIASKLGGKALITVLGTGLDLMKEVEIAKGGGEVEIPVSDDLGSRRLRHGAALPADWTKCRSACRAAPSASAGCPSIRAAAN